MFGIKNGILEKNGKKVLALGHSYYASYHWQKVPVPEEGDREGVCAKDMKLMADAGFNIVRCAALGDVKKENGTVKVKFPLVDTIIKEATKNGIASTVRLQGYHFNLSGYDDFLLQDQDNNEPPFRWNWFVRNCLNHDGIRKDNIDATVQSAKYFSRYDELVGFQIYNEAGYPQNGFYDYHPSTVIEYRKWLVKKQLLTETDADKYYPPRARPKRGEDTKEWVNWRLFNTERMSGFLNELSDKAKEGYKTPETFTCHTTMPFTGMSAINGVDYYQIAQRMDIMGITHYIASSGPSYFYASLVLDAAESAAAIYGKHAWLIEYNARCKCKGSEWERETYSAIGSNYKGILYYQWRADYPYDDGPEPDGFGLLYNNGDKTPKYDMAISMTKLTNRISSIAVECEKIRSGVGIIFSQHAIAHHDALDNGTYKENDRNSYISAILNAYKDFKKEFVTPDIIRAEDLEKNILKIKVVILPTLEGLSEIEILKIEEFISNGGKVYLYNAFVGYYISYIDYKNQDLFNSLLRATDVGAPIHHGASSLLEYSCIYPDVIVENGNGNIDVKAIGNEKTVLLSVINYDSLEKPAKDVVLKINKKGIPKNKLAYLFSTDTEVQLKYDIEDDSFIHINLPELNCGAYIVLSDKPVDI
jgi:hypothetical protein